jgi:hypothetical protein
MGRRRYECRCDCGKTMTVFSSNLTRGHSQSCGCLCLEHNKKQDGLCALYGREYRTWTCMIRRCENPDDANYHRYGGRGINVCRRWHDFKLFLKDMKPKPTPQMTIERIDNNGNYEPSNCRWATHAEQNRNQITTRILEFNGERLCVTDWGIKFGISKAVIFSRLKRGWTTSKALLTPVRSHVRVK